MDIFCTSQINYLQYFLLEIVYYLKETCSTKFRNYYLILVTLCKRKMDKWRILTFSSYFRAFRISLYSKKLNIIYLKIPLEEHQN